LLEEDEIELSLGEEKNIFQNEVPGDEMDDTGEMYF
jgi:hypothetical protein